MESTQVLRVKTLGGFSMIWQGKPIGGGAKSADSQFTRLMQILLHYRTQGVDSVQMQDLLFEDSNADDVHHLVRTVVYNARKRLKAEGLPGDKFIEFRNGSYYWVADVQVEEDAAEFESIYEMALVEKDPARRTELFVEACYFYKGDFLPQQTRLVWVAEEERRYKNIFKFCIEQAAQALRERHSWAELERIGRHASSVSPLNDWETITMEALVAMGRFRAAQQLYGEAVDYYQLELGSRPSSEMVGKLEYYASRIDQPYMQAEHIQAQLNEPDEEITGGYFCSYHVFREMYRMMCRTADRYGTCALLMICSVSGKELFADKCTVAPNEAGMNRLTERMKTVICRSVRKSDVVCKYGQGQFLIILINRRQESCEIVKERINRNLLDSGLDLDIEYSLSHVRTM